MIIVPLLLACAPKPADPLPLDVTTDWSRASAQVHMSEHFTRTTAARDAIIAGHMDEARVELAWLAEHEETEGVPVEFGSWFADLRTVAATGVGSTDARGMASTIGGIGVQCGGCHGTLNIQPLIPGAAGPAPQDSGDLRGHEARHRWAADQLWIGLVQPSNTAWQQGLAALQDPPVNPAAIGVDAQWHSVVEPYVGILRQISRADMELVDPQARAETFGLVVSACAGCHAAAK